MDRLRFISSETVSKIIETRTQSRKSGQGLYKAGVKYFGSWENAITAAGIDYAWNVRKVGSWPDDSHIIRAIQALYERGFKINRGQLREKYTPEITQVIWDVVHVKATADGLFRSAVYRFGSWDNALRAANFDTLEIRQDEKIKWTRIQLLNGINALCKAGVPLSSGRMRVDRSLETKEILFHSTGRKQSGKSFYITCGRHFGSWSNALREANLDPQKYSRRWNREKVLIALERTRNAGIAMNPKNIMDGGAGRFGNVCENQVGFKSSLYHATLNHFGSWSEGLKAVGLNPVNTYVLNSTRWKNNDQIARLIRFLHSTGTPLNTQAIKSYKPVDLLFSENQKRVNGNSLYCLARRRFGSWDEALKTAGLDPYKIRLILRGPTSNLVITPHQEEWITNPQGERQKLIYFGEAPKTPEQILSECDDHDRLQKAIRCLSEEDQHLIDGLLGSSVELEHDKTNEKSVTLNLSDIRIAKILGALKTSFEFLREVEELNTLLFPYLPGDSKKVISDLPAVLDSINDLLEHRSEKLRQRYSEFYEIGQALNQLNSNFRTMVAVENSFSNIDETHRANMKNQIQEITEAIQSDTKTSIVKWLISCFKKQFVEYSKKIREEPSN